MTCVEQRGIGPRVVGATVVGALIGAAVLLWSFRHEPEAEPTAPSFVSQKPDDAAPVERRSSSEFVGSQACGECHSDVAETFSKHPMANTLARVAEASPLAGLEEDRGEFAAQGRRYRVERQGERFVHTELMTDAADRPIYEQSVEVQYAVGSGTTARSYLIDRGGILFESPITWYVDKQSWDLSPGYEVYPHKRFRRRVSDGCVQCHSGRAAPAAGGNSNRFEEPPFLELGIGCESCHGPGRRHVEKMAADGPDAEDQSLDETAGDLRIVNPGDLDPHRASSVCYQCHMEGKRRILRKGKSFHDFRPGMATEDLWTVFVAPASVEAAGAVPFTSQAEQMHSSACFRGSDGRMSCTSCHDPHRAVDRDMRSAFYRDRCNRCHADHGCSLPIEEREPPPALNSCIHCHMPTTGAGDLPHAAQSDHRVLRDPLHVPGVSDPPDQVGVWAIFDESERRLPEWELQRARALALCEQAIEERDQRRVGQAVEALEAVRQHDPRDVTVLRSLGVLYGVQHKDEQAMNAFASALRMDPHDELSLKNLGLLAYRSRSFELGLSSYQAYLQLNAWDPTMYGPFATMLAVTGNVPLAVDALEQGLRLDPTERELRRIAVQMYQRLGDQKKSRQHREILQAISTGLQPWDQKRKDRIQKLRQQSAQGEP